MPNVQETYKKFFADFQEFMYSNNVLVAATGLCVGMATKEMIESVLNEAVLPIVHTIGRVSIIHNAYLSALKHVNHKMLSSILSILGSVSWSIFVWVLVVLLTFVMLEYVLNRKFIGLKSTIKDGDKINYIKAKQEAKESIIPTQAAVQQLEKEEKVEKVAVKQLKRIEEQALLKAERSKDPSKAVVAVSAPIATQIPTSKLQPPTTQPPTTQPLTTQPLTTQPTTQQTSQTPLEEFFAPLL